MWAYGKVNHKLIMFWLLLLPSLLLLGELPKANRILSSLQFQYFSQYSGSSQEGTLLHYSNTACVCRAFPSTNQILQKHFQGALSLQGQSLHFSIFTIFRSLFSNPSTFPLFLFLFLYTYISWCSNINNYPLLFFLVNNLPISCQYYYYYYYFYYYHFINIFIIVINIIIIIIIMSFYVVFAQAVLNTEIFFLGELQLVAKNQEDAFTSHI